MGRSTLHSPRKRPQRPQKSLTLGPVRQRQLQCGLGLSQNTSSPTRLLPHPPVPSLAGGPLRWGKDKRGGKADIGGQGLASVGYPRAIILPAVKMGQRLTRVMCSLSQSPVETPRGPAAVPRPPCGWERRMAGTWGSGGRSGAGPPGQALAYLSLLLQAVRALGCIQLEEVPALHQAEGLRAELGVRDS